MRTATLTALASIVVLTADGCSSARRSEHWSWAESRTQTVTVRNENWLDVAVYVVRGTSRFRIGTVTGLSEQTLRIKAGGADGIPWQIMANPIGSNRAYVTEPVVLAPGQRLGVNVASRIGLSTYAIWDR